MDVHPPKNGIFIGIDPGCHMFPQFLFHKSSHFRWPQDFIQILDDVGDLVASQLRRLSSASVAVRRAAKAMGCGVERVLLGALEMQNPRCCCCWWRLFVGFLLAFCWLFVDLLLTFCWLFVDLLDVMSKCSETKPWVEEWTTFFFKSGNPLFTATLARKRGRWFGFS